MYGKLELQHGDLADDRVQHVFGLGGQQDALRGLVRRVGQQLLEGQHFAEDRRGFRERERRVRHQRTLRPCQNLMDAVAQFVGEGHNIHRFPHVIQ